MPDPNQQSQSPQSDETPIPKSADQTSRENPHDGSADTHRHAFVVEVVELLLIDASESAIARLRQRYGDDWYRDGSEIFSPFLQDTIASIFALSKNLPSDDACVEFAQIKRVIAESIHSLLTSLESTDTVRDTESAESGQRAIPRKEQGKMTVSEEKALMKEIETLFEEPKVWLEKPNPRLGGATPRELIDTGQGRAVRNFIGSMRHGIFS